MNNQNHKSQYRLGSIGLGCLLALSLLWNAAQADETQPDNAESAPEATTITLGSLGNATRLSSGDLDEQRAKAKLEVHSVTINDQDLNGQVSGNTAINTNTGNNVVSSGAFTNSAGFTSTVQNSGNNVLIQNSTIVNVEIAQ